MNVAKQATFAAVFLFGMLVCEYAWAGQEPTAPTATDVRQPAAPATTDVRQPAAPLATDAQQPAAPITMDARQPGVPATTDVQGAEAYARLPVCKLNADGTRLEVEPCRTAPAQAPMPRRPVPQIVQPLPPTRTAPQPAMPTTARPVTPVTPSLSRPPVPVTHCDAGGCYGANGVRYNNAGNGVVGPNGKVCTRAGATIQC